MNIQEMPIREDVQIQEAFDHEKVTDEFVLP